MREEWQENELRNAMGKVSRRNRVTLSRYIKLKRANGLKVGTLVNYVYWLRKLEEHAEGKAFEALTPDDLTAFFADLHAGNKSGKHPRAQDALGHLRPFLKWLLDSDPLPSQWARAIKQRWSYEPPKVDPVTDEELGRLLRACTNVRDVALVRTLADSGFRNSELCGLNVGSVKMDGGQGATLTLPKDAHLLKTGARSIYVVRCVPAIRAWLNFHPAKDDPDAPLFPKLKDKRGQVRLDRAAVYQLFRRLCKDAKLRRIHPHLLRHTRATEAARNGWNEPQMRAYFGWGRTSRMPSHYTHLAFADLREQVLADAVKPFDNSSRTLTFSNVSASSTRANDKARGVPIEEVISSILKTNETLAVLLQERLKNERASCHGVDA